MDLGNALMRRIMLGTMRLRRPDVDFPQTGVPTNLWTTTVVPRRLDGLIYTWLEDDSDTPVLTVTVDVRFDRDGRRARGC